MPEANTLKTFCFKCARTRFSKAPKAIEKSRKIRLQSCFIQIFLIWTEVPFKQELSGLCTSPFLDMALRALKVSGALGKRAPTFGNINSVASDPCMIYK